MEFKMTMGERFRQIRKYTKMTQKEFADSLGVTQTTISGIEKDSANPSLTLIKLICQKYFVNEEWLSSGIGEMIYLSSLNLDSVDGLLKKYVSLREKFENNLYMSQWSTERMIALIDSFRDITQILYASNIIEEKKNSYLKNVSNIMDSIEGYIFRCSSLTATKKEDYELLYDLELIKKNTIKKIYECLENIFDLYKNQPIDENDDLGPIRITD